uniref:Uncharacterized protein n=1 Tax=Sphaeramia orbicularis TaxID=375764 RepID=A0A673B0B1_9TELE
TLICDSNIHLLSIVSLLIYSIHKIKRKSMWFWRVLTPLHLLAELRHVVWPDGSKELDVVVTVILCHLLCCGFEEVMGHSDAVRFHGMPLSIVVISNVTCKETNQVKRTLSPNSKKKIENSEKRWKRAVSYIENSTTHLV